MKTNDCDALLSTADIGKFLGVTRAVVYKWIGRGMPVNKEGPKEFSGSKKAINEWFYQRAVKKPAKNSA